MIGEIVHYTKASGTASRASKCHPAVVMAEFANDHRDMVVFNLQAMPIGRSSVAKGERHTVDTWHKANHEEK